MITRVNSTIISFFYKRILNEFEQRIYKFLGLLTPRFLYSRQKQKLADKVCKQFDCQSLISLLIVFREHKIVLQIQQSKVDICICWFLFQKPFSHILN